MRITLLFIFASFCLGASAPVVHDTPQRGDFPLVTLDGKAAPIVVDAHEPRVVAIAADCLADDVLRVTGVRPQIVHELPDVPAVVLRVKPDDNQLKGQWESFRIEGKEGHLLIAGSDRRGVAFGVFEISRAIGVSPWYWWADVPPRRHKALYIAPGPINIGPPSVKYRGIFINDEDWSLHPWAAKTFDPQTGDIAPKTYAKVFELLLRLRANYLWPAMHPSTKAFNFYPQNKQLADDWAIVVGSSHCEQMLRNNISEWPKDQKEMWNPLTNLPAICDYWEQRVRENAKFESTWTLGMRGIHDSGMPGPATVEEKRDLMTRIIAAQRAMIAKHIDPDPARVPQIFCPYKEVLDIYRAGLKLPDDVTIVWPDDNFGYIRQLPDAAERKRAGRHGIYYHLSYYGRPADYLWLESNSPALIWQQMTTAFEYGADRLWVVNVGDIKPAECGISFFLDLAWDARQFKPDDVQKSFLRAFYAEQFGAEQFGDGHAEAIADIKDEYFRLCAMRKPEHLGYRLKDECLGDAVDVNRWVDLASRAAKLATDLPSEMRPAYFELVQYPACAAAAMVEKFAFAHDDPRRARAAYERIQSLTDQYNSQLDGKWRNFMDFHPRKLAVFAPPSTTMRSPATTAPTTTADRIAIDPTHYEKLMEDGPAHWTIVPGLGRRGAALAVVPPGPESAARAPRALYKFTAATSGRATLVVEALPTQSLSADRPLSCTVSIDDAPPVVVTFAQTNEEHDPTWSANIVRNAMFARGNVDIPTNGTHMLTVGAGLGGNIVLQRITLSFEE